MSRSQFVQGCLFQGLHFLLAFIRTRDESAFLNALYRFRYFFVFVHFLFFVYSQLFTNTG